LKCSYDNFRRVIGHVHHIFSFYKLDKINYEDVKNVPYYELKRLGYDLDRIAARVAEIYGIKRENIFLKGKQQKRVKARSLLCFWAARELGISLTELARRLGNSVPGVGYSVVRGERIARESDYQLVQ